MLFNKDFLKEAKILTSRNTHHPPPFFAVKLSKLLSAIISSIFVWFTPSQRRFGDFKHHLIDWTLLEREI